MTSSALHLAGTDVVRFVRRRETFWIIAMGLAGQLAAAVMIAASVAPVVDVPLETASRASYAIEWVALGILAYYVAFFGQRAELDGSWTLLTQTPVPRAELVAGKMLGAAASCLVVHAALLLPWAAIPVPGARLQDLFWPWLYAVTLIPEAMLLARVHARSPRLYVAVRALTLLRIGMPLLLMALAVAQGPSGRTPASVAWRSFFGLLGIDATPVAFYFPDGIGPIAIIFSWQLLTAIPLTLALVRGR